MYSGIYKQNLKGKKKTFSAKMPAEIKSTAPKHKQNKQYQYKMFVIRSHVQVSGKHHLA